MDKKTEILLGVIILVLCWGTAVLFSPENFFNQFFVTTLISIFLLALFLALPHWIPKKYKNRGLLWCGFALIGCGVLYPAIVSFKLDLAGFDTGLVDMAKQFFQLTFVAVGSIYLSRPLLINKSP